MLVSEVCCRLRVCRCWGCGRARSGRRCRARMPSAAGGRGCCSWFATPGPSGCGAGRAWLDLSGSRLWTVVRVLAVAGFVARFACACCWRRAPWAVSAALRAVLGAGVAVGLRGVSFPREPSCRVCLVWAGCRLPRQREGPVPRCAAVALRGAEPGVRNGSHVFRLRPAPDALRFWA